MLGSPRALRGMIDAARKTETRIAELRRMAPLANEHLLTQYVVAEYDSVDSLRKAIKHLSNDRRVIGAYRNFRVYPSAETPAKPAPPLFIASPMAIPGANLSARPGIYQWGHYATYLYDAHTKTKGRAHVAILDRGIMEVHPELQAAFRPQFSRRFSNIFYPVPFEAPAGTSVNEPSIETDPDTQLPVPPPQANGHGTHAAGLIAASGLNLVQPGNVRVTGSCPGCSLHVFRVDTYDAVTMTNAIQRAVYNGVAAINMSFGTNPTCVAEPVTCDTQRVCNPNQEACDQFGFTTYAPWCQAMDFAKRRGVTLVAASGNCGLAAPDFPASYAPAVIAAGGLQRTFVQSLGLGWLWRQPNNLAPSSNAGTNQLLAPAADVLSTTIGAMANGVLTNPALDSTPTTQVISAGLRDIWIPQCGNMVETNSVTGRMVIEPQRRIQNGYGNCNGTSMAAPYVSGVAGLVLSANPLATPDSVRNILLNTATPQSAWLDPGQTVNADARPVLNANAAVNAALGGSGLVSNRYVPLFHLHAAGLQDRFYTTAPQMAAAALTTTLPPAIGWQYVTRGWGLVGAEYQDFPSNLCGQQVTGCSPTPNAEKPRADFYVYSTANAQSTAQPLRALTRLSNRTTKKHAYTTNWPAAAGSYPGYELDGIEGYVIDRGATPPAGAVKICRKQHSTAKDVLLFPGNAGQPCPSSYNADGYTYNQNTEGIDFIGFAWPVFNTTDTDGDGLPDVIEVIEPGRNLYVKDNDIFQDNQQGGRLFAMQQYRDIMSREAPASEYTPWATQIATSGAQRAVMINSLISAPEYDDLSGPIIRLYSSYFLRQPDYNGMQFWIGQYRQGVAFDSISQFFATSPEFISRYGTAVTNDQFVTLCYQNVLNRAPDAGGFAYWVGELNSGRRTRGNVMNAFSESAESKLINSSKVRTVQAYATMVRRAVDPSGYAFWPGQVTAAGTATGLINALMVSGEYRNRFLP